MTLDEAKKLTHCYKDARRPELGSACGFPEAGWSLPLELIFARRAENTTCDECRTAAEQLASTFIDAINMDPS